MFKKANRDGKVTSRDYSNKWNLNSFRGVEDFMEISGWSFRTVTNYVYEYFKYVAVLERNINVMV